MSTYQLKDSDKHFLLNVWNKALKVTSLNPDLWRLDRYFRPIKFTEYGNRDSKYGWEIDHIISKAHGGTNDYPNLQPLNWKSNSLKSDNLF